MITVVTCSVKDVVRETPQPSLSARQVGFTLIEVMVVVVIVAILATVALPAYQDSVRKGRRASAQGFLLDLAQREQQYFVDGRAYATSLSDMGVTVPSDVDKYYLITIEVDAGPPPNFVLVATPKTGPQSTDGKLSIDRAGNRLPAGKW